MNTRFFAAGTIALALAHAGAAHASGVTDGDFTQGAAAGSFTTIAGGHTIGPWTVTGNSVDLIGSYWERTPDHGYTVDLDGNGAGGVRESVGTLAAGTYELGFYLGGNPDGGPVTKRVKVSIDGITVPFSFNTTGATHGNMGYEYEYIDFTVAHPTSTSVSFTSLDAANNPYGPVLGEVTLTAIPEPASLALMLGALGAFGLAASRRRHARRD